MATTSGTRKKSVHGAGHGPGQGPGWGGQAKGAHEAIPANEVPIGQSISAMERLREEDPEEWNRRRAKTVERKDRAGLLEDELFGIAMDLDVHPATRINAADKALDRLKGKAVQRNELTGADGEPLKMEQIRRVIVDPKSTI